MSFFRFTFNLVIDSSCFVIMISPGNFLSVESFCLVGFKNLVDKAKG
jgi:hypothetical protein